MIELNQEMPAPNFRLPSNRGEDIRLGDFRQRQPVVLLFLDAAGSAPARAMLADFAARYADFQEWGAEVLAIAPAPLPDAGVPFPVLVDAGGEVRARYVGDAAGPAVFVLDRFTAPYRWQVGGAFMSAADAVEWVRLSEYSCTTCDDVSSEWAFSLELMETSD